MYRAVVVEARPGYRIWLEFEDGTQGEVDLSHLVGKGVFCIWNDAGFFEQVTVASSGEITWAGKVDLCAHALYLKLTGQQPEDVFPGLAAKEAHA